MGTETKWTALRPAWGFVAPGGHGRGVPQCARGAASGSWIASPQPAGLLVDGHARVAQAVGAFARAGCLAELRSACDCGRGPPIGSLATAYSTVSRASVTGSLGGGVRPLLRSCRPITDVFLGVVADPLPVLRDLVLLLPCRASPRLSCCAPPSPFLLLELLPPPPSPAYSWLAFSRQPEPAGHPGRARGFRARDMHGRPIPAPCSTSVPAWSPSKPVPKSRASPGWPGGSVEAIAHPGEGGGGRSCRGYTAFREGSGFGPSRRM